MRFQVVSLTIVVISLAACSQSLAEGNVENVERQITTARNGHILTNIDVWSPDSQWIVYDVRSDAAGDVFDGEKIERVHVGTGEVQVLFRTQNGAFCGVATYSRNTDRVVFIHGPEEPNTAWAYAACHRRGVLVDSSKPGKAVNLDARDLVPPFTTGALRGGTHVHTFSPDGRWVSFTYEDHVLQQAVRDGKTAEANQRNVGVSVAGRAVVVPSTHRRNHDGSHFTVLVTRTTDQPRPGSDEVSRAFSDAWIGTNGYEREDGTRQEKAIAFQGLVRHENGQSIPEVFIVDIPEDATLTGQTGPLMGTATTRPQPPKGTVQRRLTFTTDRAYPGIQGVRHWLRSSPDGSKIAFLMKSDAGVAQLWTVSPGGGEAKQLTDNQDPISSAFSWSPDGEQIAHTMNGSVCVTAANTGTTTQLTKPTSNHPIRPEACVFSPDGNKIAYVRHVATKTESWNQIFVLDVPKAMESNDER